MKFRKKPIVIEAVRCEHRTIIDTLEGQMTAEPGDWIITGIKGERYPCKPDIFERTYEPVEESVGQDAADLADAQKARDEPGPSIPLAEVRKRLDL